MEEEVMYWNVSLLESILKSPSVKGTSYEEEIREVLDRVMYLALSKEL